MLLFCLLIPQPVFDTTAPVSSYSPIVASASAPVHVKIKWYDIPDPEPQGWEAPGGNSADFSISAKDSDTWQNYNGTGPIGNPYLVDDPILICVASNIPPSNVTYSGPTYRGIDGSGRKVWDWGVVGPAVSNNEPIGSKPKQPVKYINEFRIKNQYPPGPGGIITDPPAAAKDEDVIVQQVVWVDP